MVRRRDRIGQMIFYLLLDHVLHLKRFPVSLVPTDGYPDIKMNVKFVQDTSKFWYKPDISREQGETRTSRSPSRQIYSNERNDELVFLHLPIPLLSSATLILSLSSPPSFSHQSVEGQGARGLHHKGQPFLPWGLWPGHEGGLPATDRSAEQKRCQVIKSDINVMSAFTTVVQTN